MKCLLLLENQVINILEFGGINMIYLRRFNEAVQWEKIQSEKNYIEDILLELEDIGYNCDISGIFIRTESYMEHTGYKIELTKNNGNINEIKYFFNSLYYYLKEKGYDNCWIDVYPKSLRVFRINDVSELQSYNDIVFNTIQINFRFRNKQTLTNQ